mgnify:CR=1 FL=1
MPSWSECAVAFPYKNGVKVQSTDQGAYDTRKECAHMFGWDSEPERVVVETMLVGAALAARRTCPSTLGRARRI